MITNFSPAFKGMIVRPYEKTALKWGFPPIVKESGEERKVTTKEQDLKIINELKEAFDKVDEIGPLKRPDIEIEKAYVNDDSARNIRVGNVIIDYLKPNDNELKLNLLGNWGRVKDSWYIGNAYINQLLSGSKRELKLDPETEQKDLMSLFDAIKAYFNKKEPTINEKNEAIIKNTEKLISQLAQPEVDKFIKGVKEEIVPFGLMGYPEGNNSY